jgi:hypothetical protein
LFNCIGQPTDGIYRRRRRTAIGVAACHGVAAKSLGLETCDSCALGERTTRFERRDVGRRAPTPIVTASTPAGESRWMTGVLLTDKGRVVARNLAADTERRVSSS